MQEALFNPLHGYYTTKNPIGKNSDFITSSEISQVFGEILAAYILEIAPKGKVAMVEMGAGRGVLFYDILQTIKKLADKNVAIAVDFLERSSFHIIEIGQELRKTQQEKLKIFANKISWHHDFQSFLAKSENEKIIFLSNELFDCFPIDQFVRTNQGWCERLVALIDDELQFSLANFDPAIDELVSNLIKKTSQSTTYDLRLSTYDSKPSTIFEYSFAARKFMQELCQALQNKGGIAINFDYGYYNQSHFDSLQSIKNHQKISPLQALGESDLTALVDFSALEIIAKEYKLNSSLVSQKDFLLGLGIEERRKFLIAKNPQQESEINSAIDRLISSDQMGELFKCHIIWK